MRIFPHWSSDQKSGIAFEVDEGEGLDDSAPLNCVLQISRQFPDRVKSLGPWYYCEHCRQSVLEYEKTASNTDNGKICRTCHEAISKAIEDAKKREEERLRNLDPYSNEAFQRSMNLVQQTKERNRRITK